MNPDAISLHEVFANDPRVQVRTAILRTVAMQTPEDHHLVLGGLHDASAELRRAAKDMLIHHYPWLCLHPAYERRMPDRDAWVEGLGPDYQKLSGALESWVAGENPLWAPENAVWEDVPLLRRMVGWALQRTGRETKGGGYLESLGVPSLLDKSRQALFILTYGCNLDCSYCYALKWNKQQPGVMSPENRRWALDWCIRNQVGSLVLGGGEPSTYPFMKDFVVEAREREIGLNLTSNALFGEKIRQLLRPDCFREFTAHYDQEFFSRQGGRASEFRLNLERAVQTGLTARLRYTITGQSDRGDWLPMLDMARETGVRTIGFGFSFENFFGDNQSFTSGWRERNGHLMEELLERFLADIEDRDLVAHLSKPMPLCGVSVAMLRRLGQSEGMRTPCSISWQGFTRNLTINPDLSTLPCNAIFKPGPNLRQIETLESFGRFYQPWIESWMEFPEWSKCAECPLHYAGVCQPSCIARQAALDDGPDGNG